MVQRDGDGSGHNVFDDLLPLLTPFVKSKPPSLVHILREGITRIQPEQNQALSPVSPGITEDHLGGWLPLLDSKMTINSTSVYRVLPT